MKCRDAQFYLRLQRHATDELGVDVTAALSEHTTSCPACAADAHSAASFDLAIATAMKAVPVPSALREKLITHVASKQGLILRRKLYRSATIAAAAVVLAFLGLGVFSSTRPKLDTQAIAENTDDQLNRPDEYTREWLLAQKLPDRLPLKFDYEHLGIFRVFEEVQGSKVPVVIFTNPTSKDFAKVYIFRRSGRIDVNDVRAGQASHTSADIYDGPGVIYLVVYTGGPQGLQQFLTTRKVGGIHL